MSCLLHPSTVDWAVYLSLGSFVVTKKKKTQNLTMQDGRAIRVHCLLMTTQYPVVWWEFTATFGQIDLRRTGNRSKTPPVVQIRTHLTLFPNVAILDLLPLCLCSTPGTQEEVWTASADYSHHILMEMLWISMILQMAVLFAAWLITLPLVFFGLVSSVRASDSAQSSSSLINGSPQVCLEPHGEAQKHGTAWLSNRHTFPS